jgi:Mg2+/Co2+ transporter CorB
MSLNLNEIDLIFRIRVSGYKVRDCLSCTGGLGSVVEAVLLSVTPSYIVVLREQGKRVADLLEQLKENIDRALAAILSLNTIAHTAGAAGVGAQGAEIWGNQAVGWASAGMTLLILVLSEIIPKTIGAVYWRAFAPEIDLKSLDMH